MPTKILIPELPTLLQRLLEERQRHADALARIDEVLTGVGAALGGPTAKRDGRAVAVAEKPATAKIPSSGKKRRKGSRFAISAEDSILAFVKEAQNPTTQEIKKHWATEGRASSADNTLSVMVKQKKLKRTPLGKGIRGSRYSLA